MTRMRVSLALAWGAAALWAWGGARSAPVLASPSPAFVVHEWGTFSTFSGSDGTCQKFYPDDRDLPAFVYSRHRNIKGGIPDVYVSLETPVLYFYSDRERTASVQVYFPKGRMTEWYPQASRPPAQGIQWDNFKVYPRGQDVPLQAVCKSRYFAARETDAAPVQVAAGADKKEQEKFLFYRGVADFRMPLVVRAPGEATFKVKNAGKDALPAFIVVSVRDGKVRFRAGGRLAGGAEATIVESPEESTAEQLAAVVTQLLIREGLFEKEARAMVKTWRADWFGEEGTRVLYVIPPSLTEEFLPLRVTPRPDALIRVLVGRHDVLTPEKEAAIDRNVEKFQGPSNAEARAADAALNKLGRYRAPAESAARARLKNKPPRRERTGRGGKAP